MDIPELISNSCNGLYQPSFALNHRGEESHVIDAIELAGVDYLVVDGREGRADEARPTEDASVLGRVLAVLGAPVGPKTDTRLSLPDYLEGAPDDVRETFVYSYLENRAIEHDGKATLTVREDRNRDYAEPVRLVRSSSSRSRCLDYSSRTSNRPTCGSNRVRPVYNQNPRKCRHNNIYRIGTNSLLYEHREEFMPLIDDEGNLFGVVNVIDALAVCLIIAVLVAGVAVVGVLGDGKGAADPETAANESGGALTNESVNASQLKTQYATINIGTQPDYVAEAVNKGDQATVATDGHNLTITDVYVSPTNGGDGHVIVRAKLEGAYPPADEPETAFQFDNRSIRLGSQITIDTADYVLKGTVQQLQDDGTTLNTERTSVQLESNVSATTANAIEIGDEYQFDGQTIATVTDVETTELENTSKVAVDLEADLVTFDRAGTKTFGGRSLSIGTQITLRTESYDFSGELTHRGPSELIDETD
ncbi:protein of unknown function [Natrinema hispanicum]|uniref:DUF4330 family protein n=2 Tax=Natrinema hispanicum TaxID=392421 RepID=A0A1G6W1S7_9EURY|nr:protein of unknown function [Natrinema hispanicum]